VFRVSQFHLKAGKSVRIDLGQPALGIGHSADGAVWAVLIPRQNGELTSSLTNRPEAVAHATMAHVSMEVFMMVVRVPIFVCSLQPK
jgi:hypothetical protein